MKPWAVIVAALAFASGARAERSEALHARREDASAPRPAGDDPGQVTVGGFLQVDSVAYHQASISELSPAGTPVNQSRFVLRRGRVGLVYARGLVGGALQIDVNTVNALAVRPVNAELSVMWWRDGDTSARVRGSLGLIRIPFGREVIEPSRDRFFLERSNAAQAFFPGVWDLGAKGEGGWRGFHFALAVMNGEPIGEKTFPGLDPNPSKDLLGRFGFDVTRGPLRVLAGVSGLRGRGFHAGNPAGKDTLVWRDVNEDGAVQDTEVQVIAGSAATPSANFDRFALGADVAAAVNVPRLGPLQLMGEVTWAANLDRGLVPADPVAAGRDLRQTGYYVGFTQALGPYAAVGLRYDWYQPDADASERIGAAVVPRNNRFATLALAAAFVYGPSLRFLLEYDRNANALGRFPSGFPRTLGRDVVTLRGQLNF